jgi:hypothetical protein
MMIKILTINLSYCVSGREKNRHVDDDDEEENALLNDCVISFLKYMHTTHTR